MTLTRRARARGPLTDLSRKPESHPGDAVWCESGSFFLVGD
jgi:hypothetical protein